MGNITSLGKFTLKSSRNITIQKYDGKQSPEFEDKFIEYFKVTKFTTQRIPAEIISDFTKVGPLEIVSFNLVPLKLFPLKVVHSNLFPFDQTGLDEALAIMRYQIAEYSEADLGLVQHPRWSVLI